MLEASCTLSSTVLDSKKIPPDTSPPVTAALLLFMKTFNNLWPQITSFENLLRAARQAMLGKSRRGYALDFFYHLEDNLLRLQEELLSKTYCPGEYRAFYIHEPKRRMISAAPFRDRVVHHALINVIEPLFEPTFIVDSYANRRGKGTHRAIRRLQFFMKQYKYVLHCDVRKYFPSIDLEILKAEIRRKIGDLDALWLIDRIIDGSNPQEEIVAYFPGDDLFTPLQRRRGLPIGNLTSQFFANVYLSRFDHFVKEQLRCPAYLRYVDNSALLHDRKEVLRVWLAAIEKQMAGLRLQLNVAQCQIRPVDHGQNFLGQVVFPTHRLLQEDNVKRFARRLRDFQEAYKAKEMTPGEIRQRLNSWLGHAEQANTFRLRRHLLDGFSLSKA
jgi:retron-type reverse transcriptase